MFPATKSLVLFDFDGTITRRDTLFEFTRHTHSAASRAWRMVIAAPFLTAHAVRLLNARRAKEALLKTFYAGWHRDEFLEHGRRFAEGLMRNRNGVHQSVMARLESHVARGDHVCIVSASASAWVRPFAERCGVDCICTELEFDAALCFTGRLAGPNINGDEKARAVRTRYDVTRFERVVAFGNTKGDLPMLQMAHEAYMVRRDGTYEEMSARSDFRR